MLDFIERMIRRWTSTTPKQTYKKLLEQFDQPDATMVNLPRMICEFWDRLEPHHFVDGPNVRDMMYINIETRHENIGELVRTLSTVTDALIQDDHDSVMDVAKATFIFNHKITLDDYFGGVGVGSLEFIDGIRVIKAALANHYRNIENLDQSYHARLLNKMYNDILYITRVIVTQLKESTTN